MNPNYYSDPPAVQPQSAASNQRSSSFKCENSAEYDTDEPSGEDTPYSHEDHGGSKRRQRPMSVSCEHCKHRKVKCDRAQPCCGWCMRNKQKCEYKARKKPGLRAGYGRELERRLDIVEEMADKKDLELRLGRLEAILDKSEYIRHLENRIDRLETLRGKTEATDLGKVQPIAADFDPHSQNRHAPIAPSQGGHPFNQCTLSSQNPQIYRAPDWISSERIPKRQQSPKSSFSEKGSKSRATTRCALSADHPVGAATQPHKVDGLSDMLSPTNSACSPATLLGTPYLSPTLNIRSPSEEAPSEGCDLPNEEIQLRCLKYYFTHVHPWCPLLHQRTFRKKHAKNDYGEEDRILLHAIIATTMRFFPEEDLSQEEHQKNHRKRSGDKVLLYGYKHSSVIVLQALVILALDIMGSEPGPEAWSIRSLITSSVSQLELTTEITTLPPLKELDRLICTVRGVILSKPRGWVETECRRRLFWMIYLLDRYTSIVTAFDFELDEADIGRRLPCDDQYFEDNSEVETRWFNLGHTGPYNNSNLGSFSFYVDTVHIVSLVHQFLRQPLEITTWQGNDEWRFGYFGLNKFLNDWLANVPAVYGLASVITLDSTNMDDIKWDCGRVMLHASYYTTVIRLHSSVAYPVVKPNPFEDLHTAAVDHCLGSVKKIVELTRCVVSHGMIDRLGPPFAFTMWVAARVILVNGSRGYPFKAIDPDFHYLIEQLQRMERYWRIAHHYVKLLTRVYDDYSSAGDDQPDSVCILADMRRCAFDLMFIVAKLPPKETRKKVFNDQGSKPAFDQGGSAHPSLPRPPASQTDGYDYFQSAPAGHESAQQSLFMVGRG